MTGAQGPPMTCVRPGTQQTLNWVSTGQNDYMTLGGALPACHAVAGPQ